MPNDLPIPSRLSALLEVGAWPRDWREMNAQNLRPRFSANQVRRIAAEESEICLQSPPFRTVADHAASAGSGGFWPRFGALDQIVPEKVLIIADFGLGSDAPIALDYSDRTGDPAVIRLRWEYPRTQWVKCAESFDEFAGILGIGGGIV
jgi:hypothetical protein